MDTTKESPSIISLCTGIRGLERGIERALDSKLRTVAYAEIEAFIVANLVAGMEAGVLDPAPIWTNLKTFPWANFHGKVHGIIGGYPCFAAGTRIITEQGSKSIEELSTDDIVLSHTGQWRRVTNIMRRDDADTRLVCGHGVPDTITTDEHPYYGRSQERKWENSVRQYKYERSEPKWIEAKDIISKEGGTLLSQVLPEERDSEFSADFWWVIGRYIADGWSQWSPSRRHKKGGRITICCNKTESEFLGNKIRAAGFSPYHSKERTTDKYAITEHWVYEFVQQFGRGATNKHLTRQVFELPKEKANAFMEGYITGDGSRYTQKSGAKGYEITTISLSLALDIALLSQRTHGVVASIKENKLPRKHIIEGREVNQRNTYQIRIPDRNKSAFIEGNYGWKLAKKNIKQGKSTVYNISVECDESYVANGAIVHNCQPFSNAGKRGGSEDPRHLWPYIAEGIRAVQPLWCFFENVSGHLTLGYETVRGELQEMGYRVTEGIFTAQEVGAPHRRERLFILAVLDHTHCTPTEYKIPTRRKSVALSGTTELGNSESIYVQGCERGSWKEQSRRTSNEPEKLANANDSRGRTSRNENISEWSPYCEKREYSFHRTCRSSETELANTNNSRSLENRKLCELRPKGIIEPSFNCRRDYQREISKVWQGDRWPSRPGEDQCDWEEPRTIEPSMGSAINGYKFREDLLRAYGNGVVEQTAELAWNTLWSKQ